MSGKYTRREALGLLGGMGVVGLAGCAAVEPPGQSQAQSVEFSGAADTRFVELYEAMAPSVAEIRVSGTASGSEPAGGSGFLMDGIGLVTNAHVVTDTPTVEVRFHDREWLEADVIETDQHSDLAVIDTTAVSGDIPSLPFESEVPPIGTEAMVLGAPLGLGGSASTGIVSGSDRVLPSPSGFSIPAAIQTDAAVNPGNSGGPLVDLEGNVIGFVFAGATENIGFAISGPLAQRVLPVLSDGDRYEHSYLGVGLFDVDARIAAENDLPEPSGVYVDEVGTDVPAEGTLVETTETVARDGQQVPVGGDVIVEVNGTATPHLDAFQTYLALETSPGETASLGVIREGESTTVDIELGVRPTTPISP